MNPIPLPAFSDNYIWLLINEQNGFVDCVDPGDAEPVLAYLSSKPWQLRSILLTHHHQDHIGGVPRLLQAFPSCKVFGPLDSRIPYVDQHVTKDELITLNPYEFTIRSNPGHTSTHISYYELHRGWLFCGDTLFSAGCGRVFDGSMEELHTSLQLFKTLPAFTQVYCAHEYTKQNLGFARVVEPGNVQIKEYLKQLQEKNSCSLPSSIELECAINPFLRTDKPEVQHYALGKGAKSKDSLDIFRTLREQKNIFI